METLVDLLRTRAETFPEKVAFRFLVDGEQEQREITFSELDQHARALADRLHRKNAADQRVVLFHDSAFDFLPAFFACLYARAVPVPAPAPRSRNTLPRVCAILEDAQPQIILSTAATRQRVQELTAESWTSLEWFNGDQIDLQGASEWRPPHLHGGTLACLQYTSGSTRAPAGVMLTHRNFLANLAAIRECFRTDESVQNICWLPHYHDMGLVGGLLAALECGATTTLLSPAAFLQRPLRWLQALSRFSGTHSGGPNFAYDYCVRQIPEEELSQLDLSTWRVAFNGAEPIRSRTLRSFADRFGRCGFRQQAFLPCYGLAEATLLIAGKPSDAEPILRRFPAHEQTPPHDPGETELVSSGRVAAGHEVVIVDSQTGRRCSAGEEGEILVAGPSVAAGYWQKEQETAATFAVERPADAEGGRFLKTGDLGRLIEGELFVTGRQKDLLIIRGQNHYPQDIEETVAASHAALDPHWGAAISVEVDGEERLVIVHELTREQRKHDPGPIVAAIRRQVGQKHDVEVYAVMLLRPGQLPRTSSGKVQRQQSRTCYQQGTLQSVYHWTADVTAGAEQRDRSSMRRSGAGDRSASEIRDWLIAAVAHRAGCTPAEIKTQEEFAHYGIGSASVVSMAGELEQWLGRRLSPTLLYEYPTIDELSAHLAESSTRRSRQQVEAAKTAPAIDYVEDGERPAAPVAIVGIGCRFPGASGPAEFWSLLKEGVDAVGERPDRDWIGRSAAHSEPPVPLYGGFLDQVDQFDAEFFGISPREATCMDPQQRLLLEVAWEALEDAGTPADSLRNSATGVFVGISGNEYRDLSHIEADQRDLHSGTGNALSIAANRLSYFFDWTGPSLAVDTACSSSLVAVHLACRSLADGECRVAIAGGVNLILSHAVTAAFARAGFLAPDGRCKAFDARADGYVRGEGAGLVVLKPLRAALEAGDRVYAVIQGTATNQDGRSNGLTAPNPAAQQAVIRGACRRASVDPSLLQYIEAHGTGTALGDPIEVRAIAEVLGNGRHNSEHCLIGSVKTNIGHLEAAAGIAGLIKTALMLHHGIIVRSLHLHEANPLIPFEEYPLSVVTQTRQWNGAASRRLAGVSAFGFGGTNAHAVLTTSPETAARTIDPEGIDADSHLLPISARSPEALAELVRRYCQFLRLAVASDEQWRQVVVAAATNRDHHQHRLAIIAPSAEAAVRQMEEWLRSPALPISGNTAGSGARHSTSALKQQYEGGADIDWCTHYGLRGPVTELPYYPWQRKRFWMGSQPPPPPKTPPVAPPSTVKRKRENQPVTMASAQSVGEIQSYLHERAAVALGYSTEELDVQRPLTELGLDSLTAVELVHDVEKDLHVRIRFDEILAAACLSDLAQLVAAAVAEQPQPLPTALREATPEVATIDTRDVDIRGQGEISKSAMDAPAPLAMSQERLWLLAQLAGSAVLNIPIAVRLRGQLNVSALERALNELHRRHVMLRTTFAQRDDAVLQSVQPVAPVSLHVLHISPMSVEEKRHEAARLMAEAARQPFDFATGPVYRALLLRLSETEHCLLLVVSHLVADGWSLALLVRELGAVYRSLVSGIEPELPELRQSFLDYAHRQRRDSNGEVGARNRDYWKRQLQGVPTSLDLPVDKPRPPVMTHQGARRYFEISAEASRGLAELSRRQGVTPFMTLLAVYQTLLGRCSGQDQFLVGAPSAGRGGAATDGVVGVFMTPLPHKADLTGDPSFLELMARVRETAMKAYHHEEVSLEALIDEMHLATEPGRAPLFQVLLDLQNRMPLPQELPDLSLELLEVDPGTSMLDLSLYLADTEDGYRGFFEYNTDLFEAQTIDLFVRRLQVLIEGVLADPQRRLSELPILGPQELRRLITEWNDTAAPYAKDRCVHELIEEQSRRTPHETALTFQRAELTYQELDARSNQLARWLLKQGVAPETLVGLCVERSLEMVVGILGILKAGAAYVPIDPSHPRDRQRLILEDSQARIVLSQKKLARQLPRDITVLNLDVDWTVVSQEDAGHVSRESNHCAPDRLAYVLYTSGSTGRPKGVMVTHRNVVNFFQGITDLDPDQNCGTFLAVTTISFDISVMELLWTLASGFRVVIAPEQRRRPAPAAALSSNRRPMDFSLFYFECDEQQSESGKYDLVLEGARFADEHRFAAVWTPERHFHPFGGLYPNPAVVMSAVAARTRHVGIRAGSVVLPLHNPIRVAEEWAVVDNISGGRVGIAFAPGSHPNDFVFAPDVYAERKERMLREIETVRKLWRGDAVRAVGGNGQDIEVSIFPRPVQAELPVWMTAISLPSFKHAGQQGYNVLTHLLFHDLRDLTEKIVTYRQARREAGHEGTGQVTLMVHTFVGESLKQVRDTIYEPLTGYLRSSADLFIKMGLAERFQVDISRLEEDDLEAFVEQAFERFFDFNGLLGTTETCAAMVETLRAIGIDEVACLIDFGVGVDDVMDGLVRLNEVRQRTNRPLLAGLDAQSPTESLSDLILHHDVTHLQCTPAMARLLLAEPGGVPALARLRVLYVGGDTLSPSLAAELQQHISGRVHNMYGPTETTVWSTTAAVRPGQTTISIGRPLANTQVYVLDQARRLVPLGVAGELYIGGDGVTRGYWQQPELTQDRFLPDPFTSEVDRKLYRTGDQVRIRADGRLEFLGRLDHQVKIRGYRIELGEIESAVGQHPEVEEAVVLARVDASGEKQLVGFVRPTNGTLSGPPLQAYLRERLPEYMIPAVWSFVDSFPLTPNRKIDRKSLLATATTACALGQDSMIESSDPDSTSLRSSPSPVGGPPLVQKQPREFTKWRTNTERALVQLWRGLLETDREISVFDNFFELGGHSLQAAMLVTRIREAFSVDVSLRDVYESSELAAMAARIDARWQSSTAADDRPAPAEVPLAGRGRNARTAL